MPNEINIDEEFARLRSALQRDNAGDVQDVIFDLGRIRNDREVIPDEVVERLLTLLRIEDRYKSPYAGHLLNFFEFESQRLTDRAKWLCIGFLNAHGDQFLDVHSRQVVIELRYGFYLKMKKPNAQQWQDYQKMQGR